MPRFRFAVFLLALGVNAPLQAQISCLQPAACAAGTRNARELIVVRLLGPGPVAKQPLYISTSGGTVPDSVITDSTGRATILWQGPRSGGQARITVRHPGVPDREITLGARVRLVHSEGQPPAFRWYHAKGFVSRDLQWYEDRQLRRPASVELKGAFATPTTMDTTACRNMAVVFSSHGKGSEAKPDTAWANVFWRGARPTCEANAHWRLGEVGRHMLRAQLLGDPEQRVELVAKSRKIPWIGLGLAVTRTGDFVGTTTKERTITVTRRFQETPGGDSLEVKYDSTAKASSPDSVDASTQIVPVIGANFAPFLKLEWLRLYLGADLRDPAANWYTGFSILQPTSGWANESIGFDVMLVAHWGRRSVVTNADACFANTSSCVVSTGTDLIGGGLLLTASAADVLGKLFTALGVK